MMCPLEVILLALTVICVEVVAVATLKQNK